MRDPANGETALARTIEATVLSRTAQGAAGPGTASQAPEIRKE